MFTHAEGLLREFLCQELHTSDVSRPLILTIAWKAGAKEMFLWQGGKTDSERRDLSRCTNLSAFSSS